MKPTLLVLAAGMGSRYGGLKQLEGVGPQGEMILDYSLYDAIRAGFGKVVFVVRRDIEALFREKIGNRFEGKIDVDYAFQSLADLPSPFLVPPGRQKPWGTGHAILAAREAIREPFAIINADDFYGPESYHILSGFLSSAEEENFAMVGYRLDQTLSEFGAVSRGICFCDEGGYLEEVVECSNIERSGKGGKITGVNPSGNPVAFLGDEKTSLNFWGVSPVIFPLLEEKFREFLSDRGRDEKAEFYIPSAIDRLIAEKRIRVHVLPTPERWLGVTYPADKPKIEAGIRAFIEEGKYPERLWG